MNESTFDKKHLEAQKFDNFFRKVDPEKNITLSLRIWNYFTLFTLERGSLVLSQLKHGPVTASKIDNTNVSTFCSATSSKLVLKLLFNLRNKNINWT